MFDLEDIGDPSIFKLIRSSADSVRMLPTLDFFLDCVIYIMNNRYRLFVRLCDLYYERQIKREVKGIHTGTPNDRDDLKLLVIGESFECMMGECVI